mgnify:FL=1
MSLIEVALSSSRPLPFKGRAREGMVDSLKSQENHPPPNAPLEGGGTMQSRV